MNLIVTASRRADPPSYSFRRSHAVNFFSRHRVRSLAVPRFPNCQGYPVSAYRQRLCILGRSTKGVIVTRLPEDVKVIGVSRVDTEEEKAAEANAEATAGNEAPTMEIDPEAIPALEDILDTEE